MGKIESLIQFKAGEKAVASEVNQNFEALKTAINENTEKTNSIDSKYDKIGGKLNGALILNDTVEITCDNSTLILNAQSNYFKVKGTTAIETFSGLANGFVIIEFLESRILINSTNIQLQSNVNKICKKGDCGIYYIENGIAKEINFYTAQEIHTNSFQSQTILNAPKDEKGRTNFINKIELADNYMPIMTDFQNEICAISSSSYYDGNYVPWHAFRHHTNDAFGWLTQNGVNTGWLKIEFKNATPKFKAFCINARNSDDAYTHCPCDFIVEGSNDDLNWTLLGQYTNILDWYKNERRYFGLTYFDNFKYYRISITKNSGNGPFVGFGAIEFFEAKNDLMPLIAELNFSLDNPLLINNGIGMSVSGKVNQMALIANKYNLENLYNNAFMFIAMEKQSDNSFKPVVTTAQPVYSQSLQKYSSRNSIPPMISFTTSSEFNYGYSVSASSFYSAAGGTFYPFFAFNHNWSNKWLASVAGGNQWIQFDFPNYRRAARFRIIASPDQPSGCIKNGFIKGFNGEEWVILKEIEGQIGWQPNEIRNFDVDKFEECSKFKLEITDIENPAINAQVAQIEMYELAHCFVIPENKFYFYNQETSEYETREINFIGRVKTQHNFITEVKSYSKDSCYISDEINLTQHTTFAFSHNTGLDYKNLKISAWINDKTNGFIMPWNVMSILDANHEWNNNGFYYDDCLFYVRTGLGLMQYRDYNGTNRSMTANCSLVIQIERNF
jgi:hypothetical protein